MGKSDFRVNGSQVEAISAKEFYARGKDYTRLRKQMERVPVNTTPAVSTGMPVLDTFERVPQKPKGLKSPISPASLELPEGDL